jgi:hypothetical protein
MDGPGACDMERTGLTLTQAAARLGDADRNSAGGCPQPCGHFDEASQPGPSWRLRLADLRQEQAFDPLQHDMPQLDPLRPANRNAPDAHGARRAISRSPTVPARHAGKSVARRETHGRFPRRFRLCQVSTPKLLFDGECSTGKYGKGDQRHQLSATPLAGQSPVASTVKSASSYPPASPDSAGYPWSNQS